MKRIQIDLSKLPVELMWKAAKEIAANKAKKEKASEVAS